MLLAILFSLAQAKRICVCNNECSTFCPADRYVAPNSVSQFEDFISNIKNENEIEINFYSKQDGFNFEIDSTYFGDKKITLKTLKDSKPVNLKIKEKSQQFHKSIEIKPNFQIELQDLIPIKQNLINERKSLLSDPYPTPVPISIGIFQMEVIGGFTCDPAYPDTNNYAQMSECRELNNLDSIAAYQCGYRCWSGSALYSYTFKGVKFQLYGTYDPEHGKFDIELDGVIITEIDQYREQRAAYQVLYTSELLEYKEHTVKTIPKGNTYEIYKFAFWPSMKARRLNSTDFTKSSGSWSKETDGIGGVREYSRENPSVSTEIKCSKFWFYGLKDIDLGYITVTYGGVSEQVNQYSETRIESSLIYESKGLPYNTETLNISASGTLMVYCLYYEDPEVQTEIPLPTQTINPNKPTPEATPIATPIPISVGLYQMNPTGFSTDECDHRDITNMNLIQNLGCSINVLDHASAHQCGFRCWGKGSYSYSFTGVKFLIYGTYSTNHGDFSITIDNGSPITVHEQGERKMFTVVYESDTLTDGSHTVNINSLGQTYELYKLAYYPHLEAKRLNSTQMAKGGNWIKESDGIGGTREYTNNPGATATVTIPCSKFWIYGTKAGHHNSMNLIIDDDEDHPILVEEHATNREDGALLYTSNKLPYGNHKINLVSTGTVLINFIYYLDDPTPRTQDPYPSRTPEVQTANDFINKEFVNIIPNYQINIHPSSIISEIRGCRFITISENFDYFIILYKQIKISDNIFEYEANQIDAPAPFEIRYNSPVKIERCKFINSRSRSNTGNVLYCSNDYAVTAEFESCEFINCGKSASEMIIKIESSFSTLNLNNCTFSFDDSYKSSKITDVTCANFYIANCKFNKCGAINARLTSTKSVFEYINNIASSITQQFLYIADIQAKPTISGNVFQNCQIANKYFLNFLHNQDEIILENNTFSSITASSDDGVKLYGGAISLWIQKKGYTQGSIIFDQCKFYDNQNQHPEGIFAQGGAFQLGYTSSVANVSVEFNDCDFKRNKCLNGKGGALGIDVAHNITLSNCIFEENTASQEGGAIYIWGKVVKPEEQQAPNLPSSIKIESIHIIDCTFERNKASRGAAIFTEIDNVEIDLLSISFSNFTDNFGDSNDKQMMIQSSNNKFIFENNRVEYTQVKTAGAMELTLNTSAELTYSTFINCKVSDYQTINILPYSTFTPSFTMNNCDFNDCITNSYIIHLQNKGDDTISDCSFIFSNNENACAGIDIDSPDQVTIENCKFENNKNNNQGETGCLYIHRETDSISSISLNNILFDSCTGSTYSTIYVKCHCTALATVDGLNIKNTKNSQENIFIFGFNTNTDLEFNDCTFENCSSNNEFGGGIGSKLHPQEEITFKHCNWINNYNSQNGGAFQYGKETEFNDKIIKFESCIFTGNKSPKFGGALALQTHNKITIGKCQFLGNKAGLKAGSNLLEEEEGLGGAVYINPDITQSLIEKPEYIIEDNTFIDNEANNAHALYITNSQNIIVNLKSENVFTDNGYTGSTIVTDQKIDISESIFNSTSSNDQVSNPIEFDNLPAEYMDLTFSQQLVVKENQKVANFHNCTFDNCKFDQNDPQHQYVLTIHCDVFIFDNCTIKFNRADIACGAICIDRYCNASITDSYFARCNVKDNNQSAGIYYEPIDGYSNIENMIFTTNTFDEMSGINARCFKITIDYKKLKNIRDITIKNCPVFGYTGAFYFITTSTLSDPIEFIDWKFIRNSCNSLLSGGSGLWIAPKDSNTNFHLVFRSCLWDGNSAIYDEKVDTTGGNGPRPYLHNGCGGAFQFGFTESNANLQLTFDDCEFKANTAAKEGGALAIQTTKSCRITNCIFTNNEALESNGGAIFIDPDFQNNYVTDSRDPQIEISFSEFIGNNALDGSALYIKGQSATYNLGEITFTNNEGNNSVFYSSANSLDFRTSKFQSRNNINNRAIEIIAKTRMLLQNISFTDFSSDSKLDGRAIRLRGQDNTYSTLLADASYEIYLCTFRNIVTRGKGGAVYADFIYKLELRSSIFDNCKGDGAVAYVDEHVNDFSMHFNQILNMADKEHNVIVCKSPTFNINDQDFSNIGDIKGPLFDSGTLDLDGVTFEGLRTGIEVSESITDAEIKNCNFINCKSETDFIIKIKNNKCTFRNNTIICSNQNISSRAISITGYGDIQVIHNRIINCSSGQKEKASISIYPRSRGEQTILFNYNFMKGLSNCKLAIFDISCEYENVNFDHNIISECINKEGLTNNDGYMSQFIKIYSDFTIENLTFENCMSTAAFGGSFGCWFVTNKVGTTISFINCHFLNNDHHQPGKQTGGVIQMGGSSNAHFKIVFDGCTFSGNTATHDGGALSFSHDQTVTISNCVFDNNRVRDGNGGAIFLNNENIKETVTIENCIFENNFDANGNGNAIYIQNSKTQGTNLVEITSNCVFKNNFGPLTNDRISNYAIYTSTPSFSLTDAIISSDNIDNMVSGINFNGTASINSVINVTFKKCNNNKAARALAIDIHKETKSVEILSCQFISCGRIIIENKYNFDKYTIYDEGQNTKIDDCIFQGGPSNNDPRAPAIKVKSFGVHSITNIIIEYPVCSDKGAISYLDNDNSNVGESEKEDFTLDQITIKAANGNDRAALNLIIFKNSANINNITIRECTDKCLFGLELQNGGNSVFTFNEFHFLNNSCQGTYGGGSGIWIDKGNTNNIQILFNNCTFRNNNAIYGNVNHQGYGGALQLGDIKGQSERCQYTITNCIFENNYAGKYGGAITIGVENSFTVEGCQFINNRADNTGGAIYVDPGFDTNGKKTASISDCIFNNNSATNAGASIYIKQNNNRINPNNNQDILITGNCQFQMSYKSSLSIIHAKCSNLKISDVTFDMESLYKTCRAIYLEYPAYNPEIHNVIFRNCDAGGEGNAIYSEPLHHDIKVPYERIRLSIVSCRFENCGTIGWAVYVNDPALYFQYNTITYSSNTKNSGGGGLYSGEGGDIQKNTIENTFKYEQIGNPLKLSFEYGKYMNYRFHFKNNIFLNCNGEADQRCFDIKLKIQYEKYFFDNITIQNCPESQGLIGSMNIEDSSNGVCLHQWNYINNKVLINSEGYAGINIRAPNGCPIEIFQCTFENNTNRDGNGGAFQITYTNSNAYKCIIKGSTFRNNEALNGGAISITTTNKWEITDNCIFDNNKATASKSQNGGGGAIFVNTKIADQITNPSYIKSSTFINNFASSDDGTIIKITESLNEGGDSITISDINNGIIIMNETGSIISNGYNQLIIKDIQFSFGGTGNSEFRVLHAFNNGRTQLNNCKFNEIAITTNDGNGNYLGTVIRIDGLHHLIINNCEFIDCTAKNQDCNNFVIYGSSECGKTLEVSNSLFYFTSSDRSASGICIERYCKLYIDNCNFTNCHNNRPDQYAGGIRYGRAPEKEKDHSNYNNGEEEDHREYCDVRITRCTFQNCNNKNNLMNGGRVIHGYAAQASIFRNCTIRDTVDGGYIFTWGHESAARSQFVLDEFRFVNNQANCEAGGAGIWISQAENLTFRSCYFINNKQTNTTLNGGAYAVVTSTSVTQQDILFDNCYFEDNSVPKENNNNYNLGGALYLRAPSHKVTVKDCNFVDTRNIGAVGVARLGGAIYVDSDNEAGILITGCTFTHTQSLADGNAICIAEGGNLVTINRCTFTDCHHNQGFSVIWNYGLNSMEFIDSTITFTNSAQSSRGIIVFKRSNIIIRGSSFHNCVYGEHGCGFAYNPGKKADSYNNEHISIEDTIFDACSTVNSQKEKQSTVYIYTTQSFEFNQVTISNSSPVQNKNIIILEGPNGQVLEEQILKDCSFINCTTDYEQNHAGGIGLKHGNIRHLIFDSCNFNGLRSTGFGGAVAIDDMENNVKDCSVEFRNCKFENNSATGNSGQGASLYFNVPYEIYVKDCNFTSQTLSGSGGAIYGQHTSNLLIENTGFYSTQETNVGKGNAIYLARGFPTCTITGNCRFYDCGIKGSVIESEAIEFIFYQSTIQFSSNDAARALNFPCQCVLKIANSTITNCKSDSEGAGIKYDGVVSSQQEFIQIENTIFDNNNATNGCAVFLQIRSLPNITGCTIRNHQSGKYIFVIIYQVVILDEVSIKDCVFENNYYSKETDGGGSGIWIAARQYLYDSPYPIGINSCIFRNNRAKNGGGAFAYGHSGTLNNIMVNLRDCQFIGNVAEGNGGAIYLETQTECVIDGCVFTNNYVSNNANNGHAIYVNTNGKVYITDTTFIDCTSRGGIGSVITFVGTKICMEDSTVQFTQENNGSRGIEITVATDVELARDTFFRCHSSGDGGGLYLHVTTTNNEGYKLKFEDLIFDNNTAGNGCAALMDTSVVPDISGFTIRNHQSGNYVFCIFFNTIQTSFDLRTCIFESNAHNSQGSTIDGGGSGIWIANKKEIAQQRSLQLYFTECQFRDNLSPHTGGAFAIGQSDTVKATDLLIDTCTFTSNTAQSIGGALWIATRSNIEIRNSAFRNNNAVQTAGSIVIASTAPSCVINKCTFNRENANNLANAIYINSLTTETFLTENTFTDCGYSSDSNEVVAINSNYFEYVENTITFTTLLNSCRGLTIQSTGTQIIKDSKFSMCNITSGNKFGGGIYYECSDASASNEDAVEDILIDGCTFDYCHADSGSALYLNTKSIPEMKNNVIQNSKTGQYTLTLMFKKASITEFTLEEFTFYNNKASPKTITANTKYDGGGSGIYITNPSSSSTQFNLTFHKCNWTLNSSPYRGGALAYGDSQELKHTNLIFDDCIFVRNNCKKDIAGCLWLSSESDATLTINKCTFTSNKALTNTSIGGCVYLDTTYKGRAIITESTFSKNSAIDANALYIEQSTQSVSIENCNIESNGNTGSQIINFCEELNIIDSQVGFGAYTLSARSICCLARCRLTILRSTIGNCKTNDVTGCKSIDGIHNNWGGGILYTAKRTTNSEEQIIIEDTIFDNCRANNGAAILLEPIKAVVFNKNTIQECRGGNFMFCIFHQEYVEQFVFEELTFRRNKFTKNDEDGGGSGMWINNIAEKLPINTPSVLKFINCYWIENENTNAGGAVAYGKSSTIKVTALTFDKCHFTSNIAGTHGGALYIQVNKPVLIKECTFKSNSATGSNNYGGSISIDSESPSINIVGCTFESESAKDGSAVSLGPRTNNINITGCSFNDCGGTQINSVVLVRSKGVTIDDCTVQFKSRLKSSRAINISCKCNTIIRDTNFINCRTSGTGAGILLEKTDQTENEENLQIEGCLFDRCEGSNGQAIFAKLSTPIILKSNLFWYHSTKYIITVMYSDDITETFIEDCYFEHNSLFSQDPIQGGGSGFWISRDDKQAQNVIFNACTWRNNSCQNNGGAFAIATGNRNTLALEGLEFNDCIFINNTARGNGGALYISHKAKLDVRNCFFDGNQAGNQHYGGAIYIDKPVSGNVLIEDCRFARNTAYDAGAVHCRTPDSVSINSCIFRENTVTQYTPNLYLIIDQVNGKEDPSVSNCKFDFNKSPGEYQIYIGMTKLSEGGDGGASVLPDIKVFFVGNCFTHSGEGESIAHIKSDYTGQIILGEGNCFDLQKEYSIETPVDSNLIVSNGLFDCHTCQVPSVPTSPPTNMPSATPAATPEATTPPPTPTTPPSDYVYPTQSSVPTSRPTSHSSVPQTSGIEPTSIVTTSNNGGSNNSGSSSKSQSKKIILIAGIAVAAVVIIVVIIILVWLFVCRNKVSRQQEERTRNTEMNEETISGITGVNDTNQTDDPIWAGTSGTQDNLLFEGNENGEADEPANNDFEESWGAM